MARKAQKESDWTFNKTNVQSILYGLDSTKHEKQQIIMSSPLRYRSSISYHHRRLLDRVSPSHCPRRHQREADGGAILHLAHNVVWYYCEVMIIVRTAGGHTLVR
eukprot:scaffold79331_cov42-Attheya_sp.AAC.1